MNDSLHQCTECGASTLRAARPVAPRRIERFRLCPRCHAERGHEEVDGELEVEPEWYVTVQVPKDLGASQLATIRRAHQPFLQMGVGEVRRALALAPRAHLGPYLVPSLAATHRDALRAAGLVAELFARASGR